MSAPNTDLEKQQKRHWGPLSGMSLGLLVVAILFAAYVIYNFAAGDGVEGAETYIESDGSTTAAPGEEPAAAPASAETAASAAVAEEADPAPMADETAPAASETGTAPTE